ncbi:MAG: hypothetical protein QOJ71_22, partial [Actinomycetota bacterium]|nr:hypothetical protein [Actinomycetota bacterium]
MMCDDRMVSFYGRSPSGFDVEFGCASLRVERTARGGVRDHEDELSGPSPAGAVAASSAASGVVNAKRDTSGCVR